MWHKAAHPRGAALFLGGHFGGRESALPEYSHAQQEACALASHTEPTSLTLSGGGTHIKMMCSW